MEILNDEKPTATRQALEALKEIVTYKKELNPIIKEKVLKIDYFKHKETMHKLIFRDIENLLLLIEENEVRKNEAKSNK